MKHLSLFLIPLSLFLSTATASTKYYIADDETNFANPERGFYTASEQSITKSTTQSNLTDGAFVANSGRSLVYRQYVFTGFREEALSQTVLDIVDADMATYRRNGFKCVLRFSYTVSEEQVEGKYQDGSPEIWAQHLEQLKPIMEKNADVIATVQAGMLGVWGEWYYSSTGVGDAIPKEVKTNLISQMLDAVPACRTVQLRTPKYKKNYIGDTNPLTIDEAFTGSARARLGHFNDAFLYESLNMGTYTNRKKDMDYLDEECLYLPNGGESDVTTQAVYDKWATGEKAKADMAKVHFSFINQDYSQLVISNWKQEGAFNDIAMHMGYRFQLIEATIPALVRPNGTLPVKMNIRNVGYATPYNERHAYIVLYNESQTYSLPLESDPRLWAPNNAVTLIDETPALPEGIEEGTYQVALYLPDAFESLASDPRYAIRLANYDMWDDETGYNNLDMQVIVSATQPEPQPQPDPTPQADVDAITDLGGYAGYAEAYLSWKNPGEADRFDTIKVDLSQGIDTAYNGDLGNSSATVSYSEGVSTVNYETKKTWLWAGSRYLVDNLTDITSVSFELKGDGSANSLYAYAHDGTYRWLEDAFSVPLSQKKWLSYTYTPQVPLWNDAAPTHNFGDKPITDLGFIANPMNATTGSFEIRNLVVLKKHKVEEDNFAGVRIIRKEGSAPTSFSDGTTIYFGKGTSCVDAGLEHGKTYYYAAYTFTKDDKVALPVVFSLTIDGTDLPSVKPYSSIPLLPYTKIIDNGQLIIIHKGTMYNALGQKIN